MSRTGNEPCALDDQSPVAKRRPGVPDSHEPVELDSGPLPVNPQFAGVDLGRVKGLTLLGHAHAESGEATGQSLEEEACAEAVIRKPFLTTRNASPGGAAFAIGVRLTPTRRNPSSTI